MVLDYMPLPHVQKRKKRTLYGITLLLMAAAYVGIGLMSSKDRSESGYFMGRNVESTEKDLLTDRNYDILIESEVGNYDWEIEDSVVNAGEGTKTNSNAGDTEGINTEPNVDRSTPTKAEANVDGPDNIASGVNERTGTAETEAGTGGSKEVKIDEIQIDPNHVIETVQNTNSDEMIVQKSPETGEAAMSSFARTNLFAEISSIEQSPANIFFIESRCATKMSMEAYQDSSSFVLNARQCCSVESTARMNPERPVYVFHSCGLSDDFVSISAPYVGSLFNYPNVFVVRLRPEEVFRDSPVDALYQSGALENSSFPIEHSSDLIRLVLVWKYGGTYSDLDVVSIKPLSALGSNWFGIEDEWHVTNSLLDAAPGPDSEGHRFFGDALQDLSSSYDPVGWSSNGPLLLTRMLLTRCGVETMLDAVALCSSRINFTVYNSSVLYPVHWSHYPDVFNASLGPELVTSIKETGVTVHLWNKLSHDDVAAVGSQQAYSLLAQEYCPAVYSSCGESF